MNRRNPNGYYQKKRTFGKVRATAGMRTKPPIILLVSDTLLGLVPSTFETNV